ncbi:hypothetical protein CYMTET_14328 [Cymbomonas tetramitiformis]|uniref:Uncharacterized protein n=1 Tax=Cymbomonas tetramitiformis TaxID=36881 RepID=A0AAE0LAA4_9CHLO|nr:hypothetical protein CYMTET_14328 [Cymbomonas tetramitiformis]
MALLVPDLCGRAPPMTIFTSRCEPLSLHGVRPETRGGGGGGATTKQRGPGLRVTLPVEDEIHASMAQPRAVPADNASSPEDSAPAEGMQREPRTVERRLFASTERLDDTGSSANEPATPGSDGTKMDDFDTDALLAEYDDD